MKPIIDGLRFNPKRHEYFLNNKRLPSVSEIVALLSLVDRRWYKAEHRYRGSMVHWLCKLVDVGKETSDTVEPEYKGYIEAYEQFLADNDTSWQYSEVPMVHKLFHFAGRPDRVGTVNGTPCVLDIKSGYPTSDHALQLAGYWILVGGGNIRRACLYLRSNGKYSISPKDTAAYQEFAPIFLAGVFGWWEKHGRPLAEFVKANRERGAHARKMSAVR